ncbi:non-ribosomal peptide synthetase [Paenibacillus aquistagni]|uniref:Non-ribosomal peptide synthase domain TIGR01720/amino acid adenylation domain-containing protein n=1 Tax=Paenibacillus aquistagni TaxID=1852522 RepID=A0A1X7IU97_9BACL|nr:non-ribosomal peptide synthetase [Paenibacillus aquistagni]SMG18349.1 non-ribosomal peptide synthase domain TIGR01720/amino acid adenylation domain-containing protein [Paenibacillus aquistagni]
MSRKFRMSSAQKRLFVMDQLQPASITYNIPILLKANGELDPARLNEALNQLCKRHELLRTHFVHIKDKFLQVIEDEVHFELEYGEDTLEHVQDCFQQFIRPFDLSQAPLMRAKIVQVERNESVLMLDIHHIIFDDGSTAVLLNELSELYNGGLLPELRVQYKDFSAWHNAKDWTVQEQYWLREHESELPVLEWTTDYSRPMEQSFAGDRMVSCLSEKLQADIKALSKRTGATDYMILLSAFMLLLSRYSRQQDIVVGSPIAGRVHPESQQMLGMFVNTLAIRGQLRPEDSFETWVHAMKEKCLSAYEHQEYPFEMLVEKVMGERDPARHPMFDVMFALNHEAEAFSIGGLELTPLEFNFNVAKFDLTVSMQETSAGYVLDWEYCTALFKQETIERMALHFEALLEDALKRPQVPLAELSMMTAQEQAQVMHVFNETEHPYPQGLTAIQLFESQAAAAPKRAAVAFNGQELTYQELNARANEVGRRLRALGVGPDSIVGLVTGRSLEMIIGIYGILKAGGAYLPIDPAHPIDRIRYMLADSQAPAVLVGPGGEQVRELLFDLAEVIDLAEAGQGSPHEQESRGNLEPLAEPHHLAYVIYTSGTTGQPKGVMIENRSLVHLAEWQRVEGEMNEHSVMLQKSTYIFDAAVWEIFSSTLTGAKLMMATESENEDPELLLNLIQQHKVTDALIVPSAFRMLLDYAEVHGKEEALRAFKRIYLGAEPVTPDLLERYVRITGHGVERLTNLYGPTEATVCVTSLRFQPKARYDSIPIGKPLWNTQIYVMNGDSLCGIGVPGELCVGGAGLARGYLNQQELTAEKFVKHPYRAGERLYRTGDLARWSAEGNLEYLGRIGEQVKIRGFRIELGEIESRLREIQGVQDAVVTVREDQGEAMLCGYVVSSTPLDLSKMKEQLAVHLPSYMIPAHLIQVEQLPLTRSGKVDRKALPMPVLVSERVYSAPRDEVEEHMAQIFADVLGVDQAGIDDSFYELGGDSIKAIRIVSKLREAGYELQVKSIMQGRTIRAIRPMVSKQQLVVDQALVTGIVEWTPIQSAFIQSGIAHPHHFNQSFLLESTSLLNRVSLEQSLTALVQHHDMLRAVIRDGVQVVRGIGDGELYSLIDRNMKDKESKEELYQAIEQCANQIQASMDLANGPLLKAAVFRSRQGDYLFLCIHHLVVDGVSWRILLEDLNKGYSMAESGHKPIFPPKTHSYQQWSDGLRRYRNRPQLLAELPYWREVERKVSASKLKPMASECHAATGYLEWALSEEATRELLQTAGRSYHAEANDLLLTALYRAIQLLTGQHTVSVLTEGHGRESIGEPAIIDRTVGWFTSMYPTAIDGIGGSIDEDIILTKESLRRIPNHGLGYGVLKAIGEEQALEGTAPDITFNFLGEFGQESGLEGWKLSDAPRGLDVSSDNHFGSMLSLNGAIMNGVLQMSVMYNKQQYNTDFAVQLADRFKMQLELILAHCAGIELPIWTASDLGELTWSHRSFTTIKQRYADHGYQIERIYPLTSLQEGMLFHKLEDQQASSYVVQTLYRISGPLHVDALRASLQLLAEQHEVLRTSIVHLDAEEPRQMLIQGREVEFLFTQASDQDHSSARLEAICEEDVKRGFDLEHDSLVRLHVIQLEDQEYRLLMSFHHIIMDGWCMSIIMNDLQAFYTKLVQGVELEDLRAEATNNQTKYEDYVRLIAERDHSHDMAYWEELLQGYEEARGIRPQGYAEQNQDAEPVRYEELLLDEASTRQLESYCKAHGITLNTLVEAAWGIVLQRYNNTQDVVFGKVASGRNVDLQGIDQMVGLFIHTLPVRVRTVEKQTIAELLAQLHDQALHTAQHEISSLVEIQASTGLGSPLIQSLLAFENYYEQDAAATSSLPLELMAAREQTNYPLTLLANKSKVLGFRFMYDTSLYTQEEVARLLKRLKLALMQMAEQPALPVAQIDLLDEAEHKQVALHFNDTSTSINRERTVVELFEEQVSRKPNEVAVVSEAMNLTYGELNAKANQLAGMLRAKGVKPDQLIGITAERKVETIIGLVAILKAGGAYLPIDPKYPEQRIQYLLEDSSTSLILTTEFDFSFINMKPYANQTELLHLRDESLYQGPTANPERVNAAHDLAYVIYTSGTTGQPKGVMIEHLSINRLVQDTQYVDFSQIRILQTGSLAFDASTFEIWGALLNGGELYLVDEEVLTDTQALKQAIQHYQVNTMWLTVSLFNHMVMEDVSAFDTLTNLLIGGEQLSPIHVKRLLDHNSNIKLINGYGPTESTTFAVTHPIHDAACIPIGSPIANTEVYIMNGDQLCGIGMQGELCIAGIGLARGYLNKPELTAAKFVSHPEQPEKLIYRTGDLACWRADGVIDYLGRIDEQVKIRGFRIELHEIKSKLMELEHIQDAAVIMIEEAGEKHLCGYVVADYKLDLQAVKLGLSDVLPSYMIPSQLIQLEILPVTRNGKLDRSALPKPSFSAGSNYTAPRDEVEARIAEAFSSILGAETIGIHDSFFERGGHSLRATRLINAVEQSCGVRIPLREVWNLETVARLADWVRSSAAQQLEPIPRQSDQKDYPMSAAQKRLFIIEQMQGSAITYNMPSMLRARGRLDLQLLQRALSELVARHEILRTSFAMVQGEPVQTIAEAAELQLEYGEGSELETEALFQAFIRPFDLGKAPLMRAKAVRLQDDSFLFMLDMHHMVHDGASAAILLHELTRLYNGEILSAPPLHYKDYSIWEQSRDLEPHKNYWLQHFEEEIPVLDLIADHPRPQHKSYRGSNAQSALSLELTEAVKRVSQQQGASEFMILLSIFMLLLSRYSRQEDIVVGSPIAGRVHPDTEQMLGMFVNTLAIKGKLLHESTFEDYLVQMKEICLKAFEHQEYPFDLLVEQVASERDMSRHPIFDVMFALQNNEEAVLQFNGTSLEPVDYNYQVAKFDLTLTIAESNEGYVLNWEYATDLFNRETIERMALHFNELAIHALEDPSQQLSEISVLSDDEISMLLNHFNPADSWHENDKTVVACFEEQVMRTPDKIAIQGYEGKLTYRELNEQANQLAHRLRQLGIDRDQFVGIMAERRIETIVGLVAILKAGGAYVPIDPKYPLNRISYLIQDSDCSVMLTSEFDLSQLEYKPEHIIQLAHPVGCTDQAGHSANPTQVNHPKDLAYVIYTSGTTGEPKGVMIEHHSINRLVIHTNYADFKDVHILQTGSLAFDASTFEIWGALLNGGTLYLVEEDVLTSAALFKEAIQDFGINTLFITTALFNQLISLDHEIFDSLTQLLFGGEATSEEHVDLLASRNPSLRFANVYGPTECTTFATCYRIPAQRERSKTPIGAPIANTTAYVIQNGVMCGIGIPGELHIGGAGVARGYLNRPELSKEKFVENPYRRGERMYRTGDLVRWTADGQLEYLGRMDQQIKLRGYRIELGEIESRIRELHGVKDAAVMVRQEKGPALCAYIVADHDQDDSLMKSQLAERLPSYMIPSYFIKLDQLPLTRNGKLDKKALPVPQSASIEEYTAPRDQVELALADVFEHILGASRVGIDDSFYDLGGDSIKAIRMVSKLREYGYELSVRMIMQAKTIRSIRKSMIHAPIVSIDQREVSGMAMLTPIQMDFFAECLAVPSHFNQSFMIETKDRLDVPSLERALNAVILHHDMLRAVYPADTQIIRTGDEGLRHELTFQDLSAMEESEQLFAQMEEEALKVQQSMDMFFGPLVKAAVYRAKHLDYLFLCIHHLVVDGISWRIVLEDLNTAYGMAREGREIVLPPKTLSYQDWANALIKYRESEELLHEIPYWQSVEELAAKSSLKWHEPTPTACGEGLGQVSIALTSEQTMNLLYKGGRAYQTEINDLLLAALFRSIHRLTGQQSMAVNMEGHGREPVGEALLIDRTVGWFTSVYPVAIDGIGKSVKEDILSTKNCLRHVPNRGIGYSVLKTYGDFAVRGIRPAITFNYLGEFGQDGSFDGWSISDAPRGSDIAKENRFGTPISINGMITDGTLRMMVSYDRGFASDAIMNKLAKAFEHELVAITEHCVQILPIESASQQDQSPQWNDGSFELPVFVWYVLNEDSLLKTIQCEDRLYEVLFVSHLSQDMRRRIVSMVAEHKMSHHLPHYILHMDAFEQASPVMSREDFFELCADQNEPQIRTGEVQCRLECFNEAEQGEEAAGYSYEPTLLQACFLAAKGTIVTERISFEGHHEQTAILEALQQLIREQTALRSYYRYSGEERLIRELAYCDKPFIPLFDLCYATSAEHEQADQLLHELRSEEYCEGAWHRLVKLLVTKDSEKYYTLHLFAHHSVWDKSSSQLFKERFLQQLAYSSSSNVIQSLGRYSMYIEEVKRGKGDEEAELIPAQKPTDFIRSMSDYSCFNANNTLRRSVVSLLKMGPKVNILYKEKPWDLLLHLLKVIAKENKLLQEDQVLPVFILQDDRGAWTQDYSATLGAFLDLLPIALDCHSEPKRLVSMQEQVEELQKVKRSRHLHYLERLSSLSVNLAQIVPSMLSINFQGAFDLTYEGVQQMLKGSNMMNTSEIYVNSYADYLVICYPLFERLSGSLEGVLQQELEQLEYELEAWTTHPVRK